MADSYREVTSQGWFSRIFDSIKSVLVGLLLFVVSFPLLFWNEGRAVETAKSLQEGAKTVVSVSADAVDQGNAGKLVHMSGQATPTETLEDPDFGVSASVIRLVRKAEMFQWEEEKNSETKTKLGGGSETVTNYSYTKVWSPSAIDSSEFKQPDDHRNPGSPSASGDGWQAQKVMLGAYTLSDEQVGMLDRTEPLRAEAGADAPDGFTFRDGGFYKGDNPASPSIGDERITFEVVRPTAVSVVARQVGDTFEPYRADAGGAILLVKYGTLSADSMFQASQDENATFTWILRLVGLLLMAMGLGLVFNPLAVVADVLPFAGSLLRGGIGLFALLVAASLSLVTIALAWVFYRPLVGLGLLAVAGGALFALHRMSAGRR